MLDRKMAASPVDGLIVYPEGMPIPLHATARIAFRSWHIPKASMMPVQH